MTVLSVNLNKVALIRTLATRRPRRQSNLPPLLLRQAQAALRYIRGPISDISVSAIAMLWRNPSMSNSISRATPSPIPWPVIERASLTTRALWLWLKRHVQRRRLVPDGNAQLTSDHGFDLRKDSDRLAPIIAQLKDWGCRVSLFMDPEPEDMALAAAIGADRVELYTESYAVAFAAGDYALALDRFSQTAAAAHAAGLGVNAGHDLNLANLPEFTIPHLLEVSIGHALTVDALRFGFAESVKRYIEALAARASE